jgi:enoyl-CoA hydratase
MTTSISISIKQGVGTLTLVPAVEGKPPVLNRTVLRSLNEAVDRFEHAAREGLLRVAFVRSASPKFFCAGADIGALQKIDERSITPWIALGHRVFNRLEDLPVPVIARVEGYALGGGLELAMACDAIFASNTARFGQTEARLGLVAGWGGSWRLPRRVGMARARLLFHSSEILSAREASRIRLIDFAGTADALEKRCRKFAGAVVAGSEVSHAAHKRLVAAAPAASRDEARQAEAAESIRCLGSASTRQRLADFFTARANRGQRRQWP